MKMRFKRGQTAPDHPGKVFSCYNGKYERWITPEKWEQIKASMRVSNRGDYLRRFRNLPSSKQAGKERRVRMREQRRIKLHIIGDNRFYQWDTSPNKPGLVFWRYELDGRESWLTVEKLKARLKKDGITARNRRARQMSDPVTADRIRREDAEYARSRNSQRCAYNRKRLQNPERKIEARLRCRIYDAIKSQSARKSSRSFDLIGCTTKQFCSYLEEQFEPGMNWGNLGKWEVHHRVPIAAFNLFDTEQQRLAFHFRNCQPMWKSKHKFMLDFIEHEGKRVRARDLKGSNIIQFKVA